MKTLLADLIVAGVRLIGAEARIIRRSIVRIGWSFSFVLLAALLLFAAICFLLWAAYQYLAAQLGPTVAALLCAVLAALLASLFAKIAQWSSH